MCQIRKSLNVLCASVLFGAVALVSMSFGADDKAAQDRAGLRQVASSLEKALPGFVSSRDFRSASNTALLLATARSRLDQTVAACAALSQSLEYYRQALARETGERSNGVVSNIDDDSDGMAVVRARFGCSRGRSA
jgi:hypothetical protein